MYETPGLPNPNTPPDPSRVLAETTPLPASILDGKTLAEYASDYAQAVGIRPPSPDPGELTSHRNEVSAANRLKNAAERLLEQNPGLDNNGVAKWISESVINLGDRERDKLGANASEEERQYLREQLESLWKMVNSPESYRKERSSLNDTLTAQAQADEEEGRRRDVYAARQAVNAAHASATTTAEQADAPESDRPMGPAEIEAYIQQNIADQDSGKRLNGVQREAQEKLETAEAAAARVVKHALTGAQKEALEDERRQLQAIHIAYNHGQGRRPTDAELARTVAIGDLLGEANFSTQDPEKAIQLLKILGISTDASGQSYEKAIREHFGRNNPRTMFSVSISRKPDGSIDKQPLTAF